MELSPKTLNSAFMVAKICINYAYKFVIKYLIHLIFLHINNYHFLFHMLIHNYIFRMKLR